MFSEYWGEFIHFNSTACIRSHNVDLIEQTIKNSLINEGFVPISQLPFPTKYEYASLISTYLNMMIKPYIWVFGLYPSPIDREWTVIKASVPDAFYASRKGNSYPRLSDWAMEIGSDAFLYHVREKEDFILLEAAEYGEIVVSGLTDNFVDGKMMFNNELVIEEYQGKFFLLLDMPEKFQMVRNTDRDLFHLLCDSENYWFSHNFLYDSYVRSKEFSRLGVRLLFFQVGGFELSTDSEEIWEAFDFSDQRRWDDAKRVGLPL